MATQEPCQELTMKLNSAIQRRDHQQVVNISELLFHDYWLDVIDARAHAEAMLGNFDQGLRYAQQMIDSSPDLAKAGFIRKAKIYSLYGYQQKAIDVYDECLFHISSTKTTNDQQQQQQQKIDQMTTGRKEAAIIQKKRMDFFGNMLLPIEIVDYIVPLLPCSTLISCLAVSKIWRTRVLECSIAWENTSVGDDGKSDNYEYYHLLIGALHCIAPYIINFTLNTNNSPVIVRCFTYIQSGYFSKIQSLELTDHVTQYLQPSIIILFLSSLRTKHQLTTFKISSGNNQRNMVTLPEILTCWPTVQTTVYSTPLVLQPTMRGGRSTIPVNHSLVDLEIKAESIMGHSFEPILQRCLHLRRFVLHGMHSLVFNTVFRNATPSLEIFVLNPKSHPSIPTLKDIQTRRPVTGDARLQILQVSGFHHAIPSYAALPLIHKHRETLETIYGNISSMAPMARTLASYGDFRLSSIKKLVIWIVDHPTQDFWSRLIRQSTMLHDLEIDGVYDINRFVTTLIYISPVTNLGFSNVVRHATTSTIQASLILLFERYAQVSHSTTVRSTLEMITLRYCNGINDELFTSLENVSTLHGIWLGGLRDISRSGIKQFINSISDQLTYVQFEDMFQVDDTIIITLGGMENLMSVKLQRLQNITDQGIRTLAETKNNKNSTSLLRKLVVKRCPMISNQCIQLVKQQVKAVEYSNYDIV